MSFPKSTSSSGEYSTVPLKPLSPFCQAVISKNTHSGLWAYRPTKDRISKALSLLSSSPASSGLPYTYSAPRPRCDPLRSCPSPRPLTICNTCFYRLRRPQPRVTFPCLRAPRHRAFPLHSPRACRMHFLILIFFSFYDNKQCADDECAGLGERERPPYPVDTAEKSRQKQHCGNLENAGSQKRDRRGDRTVRQSSKKR